MEYFAFASSSQRYFLRPPFCVALFSDGASQILFQNGRKRLMSVSSFSTASVSPCCLTKYLETRVISEEPRALISFLSFLNQRISANTTTGLLIGRCDSSPSLKQSFIIAFAVTSFCLKVFSNKTD